MTTISGGAHGRPEGTVVDREVVRGLHQELIRFTRMMHLMKHSGNSGLVPPAAMPIIARLVHEGPMRSSALAELTYLDPSTVSRQVDALVKLALVRRTADPDDGRATLLEATPPGPRTTRRLWGEDRQPSAGRPAGLDRESSRRPDERASPPQ